MLDHDSTIIYSTGSYSNKAEAKNYRKDIRYSIINNSEKRKND
jgi:hypothetical protein